MGAIILKTACVAVLLLNTVWGSTVLLADHGMSKMIELTTRQPYCHVHIDRGTIRNMLLAADQRRVRQLSDDSIDKLAEVCLNNQVTSAHQGGFIYPGTKWCGPGDKAKNYSDLGYHVKEDTCCREHDNCPKFLRKGECREGICNKSPYTRSHCDCDAAFRRCLQNVNTETANTIGAIFFNIVQVICFKERSPCSEWQNDSIPDQYMTSIFNIPGSTCPLELLESDRYIASPAKLTWKNAKSYFVNKLLKKFKYL